jgi:hypothetical protein
MNNYPSDQSSNETEEHYALLRTLGEYSEKLSFVSRSYYDRKSTLTFYGVFGGTISVGMFAVLTYLSQTFFRLPTEGPRQLQYLVLFTIALAGCGVVLILLFTFRSFSDRDQIAEFEILPLQQALRRLLVRASKLETHSISDLDQRIIFDLRLAEAESSLALSDWVLSTRQSLFLLSGSQRLKVAKERRQASPPDRYR